MLPERRFALVRQVDLFILAFIYFLLVTLKNSYSEITRWPWCLLPQAGLLLAGVVAVLRWRRLGQPFDALIGWTIAGIAGSTALSSDPARSGWYLAMVGGYLAIVYALAGRLRTSLLVVPALGQVCMSLASLWQFAQFYALPAWRAGGSPFASTNIYPLGHHNFVGGYLALTLPVTLVLALDGRSRLERLGWSLALLPGGLCLFTTQSRGSWLGVLLGCTLAALLTLRLDRQRWLRLGAALALAVALGIASTALNPKPAMLLQGRDISVEQRLVYWQTGLVLWQQHPLFGVGPGVTGFVFPRFRTNRQPWMSRTAQQLHSTPIHLLAETGLWGLTSYLAWLLAAIFLLNRLARHDRPTAAAVAAALLGYTCASLTDFQLENPAISATLALLAAELAGRCGQSRPAPRPLRPIGVVLVVLTAVNWARLDWAWWEATRAFWASDRPADFDTHLAVAERLDPEQPYYPLQRAQILLQRARQYPEGSSDQRHWLQEALVAGDLAVALLPSDPLTLSNIGWLHLYLHDFTGAERLFARALDEDPTTTASAQLGMGLALVGRGHLRAARPHLQQEILLFPDQWADRRWQHPPLQALAPELATGALAVYTQLLNRYPRDPDLEYLAALMLVWQGRNREAIAHLDRAAPTQVVRADQPVAIRLPVRVPKSYRLGVRALALAHLGQYDAAAAVLDAIEEEDVAIALCLEPLLPPNHPVERGRTYLALGQDYFLLRRTGGETIEYFEPRRAERWAAMDCLHYPIDGRNARLPL